MIAGRDSRLASTGSPAPPNRSFRRCRRIAAEYNRRCDLDIHCRKENPMRRVILVLLLSSSCLLAQSSSGAANQGNSKDSKGQITVQGCVDRRAGDYVLIQQDPGMTYELQGTD